MIYEVQAYATKDVLLYLEREKSCMIIASDLIAILDIFYSLCLF